MAVGATFSVVPQRCPRATFSITCSQYAQFVNPSRRKISPPSALQISIYAARHYASSSNSPKRKAPPLTTRIPPSSKHQSQPAKAKSASKPPATLPHQPPPPPRPLLQQSAGPSRTLNERLNPPSFSYPPPLEIPNPKADQNAAGHIWAKGKAYFAFYKQGIQNVRETAKLAKQLRHEQRDTVALPPGEKETQTSGGNGMAVDVSDIVLSRAEWQVVRRSRRDLVRLPIFGLIFLLFGEWTPLLGIFITPVVPEPCRTPSQNLKGLIKLESRRLERLDALAKEAPALMQKERRPTQPTLASSTSRKADSNSIPEKLKLLAMSSRLDAHSWIWDYFMRPPRWWLRWAVKRKMEYLRKDDALIVRDGGVGGLSEKEVKRACIERGIFVEGKKEPSLRKELEKWFAQAEK